MRNLQTSSRWYTGFPGWLRVQVYGLKDRADVATAIKEQLSELEGVLQVSPCIHTGRALIQYDARIMSAQGVLFHLELAEQHLSVTDEQLDAYLQCVNAVTEVAVTMEQSVPAVAGESVFTDWHTLAENQLVEKMGTNLAWGLTDAQVLDLQRQYGPNALKQRARTPWAVTLASQFKEFTTLVLLGASALSLLSGGLVDGVVMGSIVVLNAVIGAIQEQKAEKVVMSLNQFQPSMTRVLRGGAEQTVSGTDLVPGDIVLLEAGDRIPADLRIASSWNLEIDEAALTGESVPVEKSGVILEQNCPLAERKNMLYMGTSVTRGKALGVVVATGMSTEIGHLMALMKDGGKESTPLQRKVNSITKLFFKASMITGAIVFIAGLLHGMSVLQMVTTSVTLAASAVPQGLPIVITIALSTGILRMARKHTLIRKLSTLETLGRVTVICSDKTGTLTKNEMTVRTVATINRSWDVTGQGYLPEGEIVPTSEEPGGLAGDDPDLDRILKIGLLCNNSKLVQETDGDWGIQGDPTEGALLSLAAKVGIHQEHRERWIRYHEVPFDSRTGTMSVVCKEVGTNAEGFMFAKGSVESILRLCTRYQENGIVYELTPEEKELILQKTERYAQDALRVLGFAYRTAECDEDLQDVEERDLIFVGMVGMMDPPKPEVNEEIKEAYNLGLKPVMITGDHPITAIAIARQLGIGHERNQVLIGAEIERLTDDELALRVQNVTIFARVTPEHKQRIVIALQKMGHYVAMVGDGVNDSPAIHKADVGIAMGKSGTEVTKETSDMILQRDGFGSIVEGVKEGRTIIGNIRKAVGCLLTGNLAEIFVTAAAVLVGLPIPLVPIQILLMNLLTDAVPATVLAIDPASKVKLTHRQDIVDRQLYQKVATRGTILGVGSLALFALTLLSGGTVILAQTVAFATLVAGQLMQTFAWRQEGSQETVSEWMKDRFFVSALAVSWFALLAVIYVPALSGVFHTVPLNFWHWALVLAVAGSISQVAKTSSRWLAGWGGWQRLTAPVTPILAA